MFIFSFKLAENVDAQLKRMVQDLKEIIDHMNSSNANADSNEPVRIALLIHRLTFAKNHLQLRLFLSFQAQQIAKILNAHMHSLQWIESNTCKLSKSTYTKAYLSQRTRVVA